jgi:hypothetical protein
MNDNDNMIQTYGAHTTPESVPYYVRPGQPAAVPSTQPFAAEVKDGVFALFTFVLGYIFCRWVLTAFYGWGAAVFTAAYLGSVLLYLLNKGVKPSKESWFWFTVTALTGLSYALWNDNGLIPLRNMFLFCSAVYWTMSAAAVQVAGRTSNFLFLDGLNAVCVIPFRNFINQYRALGALRGGREKDNKKSCLSF